MLEEETKLEAWLERAGALWRQFVAEGCDEGWVGNWTERRRTARFELSYGDVGFPAGDHNNRRCVKSFTVDL